MNDKDNEKIDEIVDEEESIEILDDNKDIVKNDKMEKKKLEPKKKFDKKKVIIIVVGVVVILCILGLGIYKFIDSKNAVHKEVLETLPLPEITGGLRGELGIDKNINEKNIDKYLGRSDSVYRDMRLFEDPGNYEAIGGDSMLSGYIDGFTVIPLPYIIPVKGLPEAVGNTYQGITLFRETEDGKYVPNYKESLSIIEKNFPKDKIIFLMCGGGGYAGQTKKFLVSLGWDEKKIYNVGGYWYYEGKHNVEVKKIKDDKIVYEFEKVPYVKIDFDKLTKIDDKEESSKAEEPIKKDNKVKLSSRYYNYDVYNGSQDEIIKEYESISVRDGMWPGFDESQLETMTEADFAKNVETAEQMRADVINKAIERKESFIVVADISEVCTSTVVGMEPDPTTYLNALNVLRNNQIYSFNMGFNVFKKTKLYETVKYGPTVVIVKDGKVHAYTDPDKDEFIPLDKDKNKMEEWIFKNISK